MEGIKKHVLLQNSFSMCSGSFFVFLLEALGTVDSDFSCLVPDPKVALLIYTIFGALKALWTLLTNLEPAASDSMTAEKRPTWKKENVFQRRASGVF